MSDYGDDGGGGGFDDDVGWVPMTKIRTIADIVDTTMKNQSWCEGILF